MRALCASIITAGAMVGLGLTGLGIGIRYQGVHMPDRITTIVKLSELDTPVLLILVVLLTMVVVGIATAFVGLAYHHERRHYERHFGKGKGETISSVIGE
jgi:hypothetical protein